MSFGQEIPLSQHDLFSVDECQLVRDAVIAVQARWIPRGGTGFFTVGTASYLDGQQGAHLYVIGANQHNPLLREHFGATLERVRAFLEEFLSAPVGFHKDYALPGFHVVVLDGSDRSAENVAERAHFDLQWRGLVGNEPPLGTVSFTVPIEEPTGGSTLEIWHTRYSDAVALGFSARAYAGKHRPYAIKYMRGRILLHDGYTLHAIGRAQLNSPRGYRITLQGHGILTPTGWVLYW